MPPSPLPPHLLAGRALPDDLRRALLDAARGLRRARLAGPPAQPLKGRHIAIACGDPGQRRDDPVARAARGLGAHVSYIPADALARPPEGRTLARVLGGLYDAIDCDGLSPERALELQRLARIPVFDGLAGDAHPLRDLLPAFASDDGDGAAPDDEILQSLLQAALVQALC